MASGPGPGPGAGPSSRTSATQSEEQNLELERLKDLSVELYEQCRLESPDQVWLQEDLFEMNVIPDKDLMLLMKVVQNLCDDKLFKLVAAYNGVAGWKVRTKEDAAKYISLTAEQEMVYGLIDEAGAEGMWSKTLKTRTNMHESTMRSAIKALEAKRLITDMKTVEHLNRKMYIKTNLPPSERATGGPWYTDGELDEEFISMLMETLFHKVLKRSYYKPVGSPKAKRTAKRRKLSIGEKAGMKMSASEVKALRDEALMKKKKDQNYVEGIDSSMPIKIEDDDGMFRLRPSGFEGMLPWPAGHTDYPTLEELTQYIESVPVTDVTLSLTDIQSLLDVLCFDGRIEKITNVTNDKVTMMYKALRKTAAEIEVGGTNGLTEAPCGRCPVFELCEEGGPVSPSNCEYYKTWLQLEF